MLGAALAAGLTATGTDASTSASSPRHAWSASVGPRHAAGIMVSASHNPAPDNGLKVVVAGRKADDETEDELEALIDDPSPIPSRPNDELGRVRLDRGAIEAYARHLPRSPATPSRGSGSGIDCANGSASVIAPTCSARSARR